jgi:hypothetical protein
MVFASPVVMTKGDLLNKLISVALIYLSLSGCRSDTSTSQSTMRTDTSNIDTDRHFDPTPSESIKEPLLLVTHADEIWDQKNPQKTPLI